MAPAKSLQGLDRNRVANELAVGNDLSTARLALDNCQFPESETAPIDASCTSLPPGPSDGNTTDAVPRTIAKTVFPNSPFLMMTCPFSKMISLGSIDCIGTPISPALRPSKIAICECKNDPPGDGVLFASRMLSSTYSKAESSLLNMLIVRFTPFVAASAL